nr:alpha-latrotoxin associated low molecular weight protein [Latrodectus hesperus]AHC13256.1 alpha-latrotoxin associated low molecular weight protein [Latrodectus hesperus]
MLKLICIAFLVTVLTLVAGEDSLDPAEYGCADDINQEELLKKNDVCLQCEDLHKEGVVFSLCKTNCFTTQYFTNCVKDLEEAEKEPPE